MSNKDIHIILFLLVLFLPSKNLFGQGKPYQGPDDPAGDIAAIREGWMSGNRALLYFKNQTELSDWPRNDVSRWPNDLTGVKMVDGIALLIGAKVYLENDSIPVTDKDIIESRSDLKNLYFLEYGFRKEGGGAHNDLSPDGTIIWGLYPVFGYFNVNSEYPAMSNRPGSWPPGGWPSRGDEVKWKGSWNGRFGKDIHYADLETYFVANDAQDQEYLGDDDTLKYYPRPGVKIGDKNEDVTIQYGKPWGGVGLRVAARGYQWNNPQTRDAIFFEYDISNISNYDLLELGFGYDVRIGIGNDGPNDYGFYNTKLDLSYSWDYDCVGKGGFPTGTFGMAYLESPGIDDDLIDNDNDGLLNEKRDNLATKIIGPTEGIHNLTDFLEWYGYAEDDLKSHWDADEDQDWRDGIDVNENGIYDPGEDFGNDVGLDGVSPADLYYNGPDEGECNHKPDFLEGVGCEPNFAATDISESDMIGLTSFQMRHIDSNREMWYGDDQLFFEFMTSTELTEWRGDLTNLSMLFASGIFPLKKGRTERISMANVHSFESLQGLNSDEHSAPALFEKKRIVQFIYESDYRFAQPLLRPTLKATPGDGKVILTWDNVADQLTREPLLKGENDFEGYKLYKATDKYFSDAEQRRDMYGNPIGWKPIFQCDLDNGKKGAADFVHIGGEYFYLGADTGIRHYFIDNDVENGRTYYYGLAAYDYGIDGIEAEIMPSENNVVIDLDEAEEIRFYGKNVQIVIPQQKAAGYIPPEIEMVEAAELLGSGEVMPQIFDHSSTKPDHAYKITFQVDTVGFRQFSKKYHHFTDFYYLNNGFSVYDATLDTLVYQENSQNILFDNFIKVNILRENFWTINPDIELLTEVFDGIQLTISTGITQAVFDTINSGWIVGDTPINISLSPDAANYFPWQYDIIFTSENSAYRTRTNRAKKLKTTDGQNLGSSDVLLDQSFDFYVLNKSFRDSTGAYVKMDMFVHDINDNNAFDITEDIILVGPAVPDEGSDYTYWGSTIFSIDFRDSTNDNISAPNPNDVYRLDFKRPFTETDTITFKIKPEVKVDKTGLETAMDKIKAVPNPYVATNMMETALSNPMLNQRRKLLFTHIPAQCTIKIFTSAGVFVDEIDVTNPPSSGIVHWDLLTRENLEIAAGVYVYHIKSVDTGQEKIGKFAVIK